MIKKFRVTVDGHAYDVTVEMPDESAASSQAIVPAPTSPAPAVEASPPAPPAAPAPAPTPKPAGGPAAAGTVLSPLAGRVTAVVVTVGQAVKEGDHLLTLEAMKMNTFVFAPQSGKVTEIRTAVGDAVEERQVLMTVNNP